MSFLESGVFKVVSALVSYLIFILLLIWLLSSKTVIAIVILTLLAIVFTYVGWKTLVSFRLSDFNEASTLVYLLLILCKFLLSVIVGVCITPLVLARAVCELVCY